MVCLILTKLQHAIFLIPVGALYVVDVPYKKKRTIILHIQQQQQKKTFLNQSLKGYRTILTYCCLQKST